MSKGIRFWGVALAAVSAPCLAAQPPANFGLLECQVATFAYQYGSTKVPTSAAHFLYDALSVDYLCANYTRDLLADIGSGLESDRIRISHEREEATKLPMAPTTTFYVATDGSDTNPGTISAPFATLNRAAAAARGVSPRAPGSTLVYVRGGIYYLGDSPLVLSEADSNVTYASYPGETAVLSGARLLTNLSWAPASNSVPGIMVANIPIDDPRRDAWFAAHPGWNRAAPPPRVSSLFIDGVRQVRARYPNGNPQDSTGICFSATQRPGEGCPGYTNCVLGQAGNQPAPSGQQISGITPNRGNSPTQGCPQCTEYGTFQYTIYPPPPDHPVYNAPLPGIGWSNNSVFSYWASPLSRPGGAVLSATETCDIHWQTANYQHPADAVVHMFHSGLWGGWMYAVDNVTHPPPMIGEGSMTKPEFITHIAEENSADAGFLVRPRSALHQQDTSNARASAASVAAPLAGMSLWLRADDLAASLPDGARVGAWSDASGAHSNGDATQSTGSLQPTFVKNCINSLPCVSFNGSQFLDNNAFALPSQSTIFAIMYDKGTTTQYGSGVFFSKGGLNGLGSKITDAVAPAGSDDDPAPVGTQIPVLMMDWAGSPADPGQKDLATRPSLIGVYYDSANTLGFVDGCLELQDGAHGASGTGFQIGTRNDEMGRFLKGEIAEIIVYPTALNNSQRALVNTYLQQKWATTVPKHCSRPASNQIVISFGYGGYQEARGGDIHAGQHMYIENVFEELDVPGEWYYNYTTGDLFVFPNGTDLSQATIAVPLADNIVVVNGSQTGAGNYARNISFIGFTFTQSRPTFLEMYEVPSGGDWSLHRGGAVFVQDAEGIVISSNFNQTGGNAVLFSNHVVDSAITDGEFVWIGDSAILFVGSTSLADGSAPTYPNRNTIARNHIHEWGVFGKQTSCVGQALAANTSIVDNVCYNGPRAGINYNDGFGGGNYLARNFLFNAVRETGDHGPFNSWDRQPYWTQNGVTDGFNASIKPASCPDCSIVRAWDVNEHNLVLNGYNGVWTWDHDDGSQYVVDRLNFMVWGGCKNYLGHSKNCSENVILYPGVSGRSAGDRRCQTDDNGVFANQYHTGNTCTSADGGFYSFSDCSASPDNLNSTVYQTAANTLLADNGTAFSQKCAQTLNFTQWQALGQDAGSSTALTPNVTELISLGAAVLGL